MTPRFHSISKQKIKKWREKKKPENKQKKDIALIIFLRFSEMMK